MSEFIEKITFEEIWQIVGIVRTISAYYTITVVVYQKAQKLITKYKEKRQKKYNLKLKRKQIYFMIVCFEKLDSIRQQRIQLI
jgi:hypothetical protein